MKNSLSIEDHLRSLAVDDATRLLIECAARLLEDRDRLTRELAEAKARAVIPDGWVAVPVEPTNEMVDAWCEFEPGPDSRWTYTAREDAKACYRAMLSARPDPKGNDNG